MPVQLGNLNLFAVDELANKFGLNKVSVRRLFRSGKIKGRKVGKRWYCTEEDLRNYFKEPGKPVRGKG